MACRRRRWSPFKEQLTDQQIWQLVAYLQHAGRQPEAAPDLRAPIPTARRSSREKQTFRIEMVARDIETPWGLAFLPDGRLLVTERAGQLRIVPEGQVGHRRDRDRHAQGLGAAGRRLFDVEVHPQYAQERLDLPGVFRARPELHAAASAAGGRGAAAARGTRRDEARRPPSIPSMTDDRARQDQREATSGPTSRCSSARRSISSRTNNSHYGSRFTFDRQGHLFYTLGERGVMENAQDLSKPTGKIHRVNDDGSVPKDNPFVGKAGALPTIWSYGHRNPQGLAWDPVTGKLWESEHGPQGGDEINIIEPGKNYGWGVITMGVQPGITKRSEPGMEQPIVYYTPTIAPSGMVFYTGNQYPQWKNNLFVSALAGQQLRRLEVERRQGHGAGECCSTSSAASTTSSRGLTVCLYVTFQQPGQVMSASTPGTVARLVPVK